MGTPLLVLKASGWVELWDGQAHARSARMPSSTVQGSPRFGDTVRQLAFCRDGNLLATVVGDNTVQLWDTEQRLALTSRST
ncbi:hypothetical protein AB0P17_39920 [Streptomyces sp. NPDC088124]|uniref:hypothetical protein n=1 Tax=Streptomyces sp. NPDC088124 TaxID=3154654 RepID=UPI00342889C0